MTNPEYKAFRLGDLFEVLSSKHNYHANQIKISDKQIDNSNPYVVRSALSNGIRGFIIEDIKNLNDGNTISFAQDTFIAFYQKQPYYTGNKIKVISPKKNTEMNELTGIFLAAAINKSVSNLTWGTGSDIKMIENIKISLPVTSAGEPDFAYMADYIKQIQADYIKQIQAYLQATGLTDTTLTEQERGGTHS
jgi:hypothetical protein